MKYENYSVCVCDNGLFSELALTLSRSFGKVWYTTTWVSGFPLSSELEIAEGIDKVERIDDVHEIINDCDLFIFPDVYQGTLQTYLTSIGKRVWGSRKGDNLEIYRRESKELFEKLEIPQGDYIALKGMSQVRQFIQENDNEKLWIKGNKARGDFETFNVESYDLGKNKLDEIESRIGPVAADMVFIIEANLNDSIDIAIDTFCIDGKYPKKVALGTEEKGECYIAKVNDWQNITEKLTNLYDKLSNEFTKYEYRNFLSLESRVDKDNIYLGDPCCRCGSPPFELQLNWIKNLDEIIWEGAAGKLIEPIYNGIYGVELIVHSDWVDKHPLMVDFPEKYRDKIKFRYNTEFDGKTWILPQNAGPRIAAIINYGDSLDSIIEECKEISGQIKGTQVESFTRAFPIAEEKIEKLKSFGVWN